MPASPAASRATMARVTMFDHEHLGRAVRRCAAVAAAVPASRASRSSAESGAPGRPAITVGHYQFGFIDPDRVIPCQPSWRHVRAVSRRVPVQDRDSWMCPPACHGDRHPHRARAGRKHRNPVVTISNRAGSSTRPRPPGPPASGRYQSAGSRNVATAATKSLGPRPPHRRRPDRSDLLIGTPPCRPSELERSLRQCGPRLRGSPNCWQCSGAPWIM